MPVRSTPSARNISLQGISGAAGRAGLEGKLTTRTETHSVYMIATCLSTKTAERAKHEIDDVCNVIRTLVDLDPDGKAGVRTTV